jgi:hypothetical protein
MHGMTDITEVLRKAREALVEVDRFAIGLISALMPREDPEDNSMGAQVRAAIAAIDAALSRAPQAAQATDRELFDAWHRALSPAPQAAQAEPVAEVGRTHGSTPVFWVKPLIPISQFAEGTKLYASAPSAQTEIVAWQARKGRGDWGPPTTTSKVAEDLRREGYEVRALVVASAPSAVAQDTARLGWLESQGFAYGFADVHEGNSWAVEGPFRTVREAIDAAMAQGGQPGDGNG